MPGGGERLFIAVPLPPDSVGYVRSAQAALPKLPGIRLVGERQWHFTIAFLGEVDMTTRLKTEIIVRELSALEGGTCSLAGFLMLPSAKRTRVVALEVRDPQQVFDRLFEAVMGALENAGVMEREKRPFRPHLTIARLREPGMVLPKAEVGDSEFAVESLCLYRSELKRTAAEYTVLSRRTLSTAAMEKADA